MNQGNKTMKNQKHIIRCDRSGVFYAEIAERRGSEADLVNARRIWRWEGANTLSDVATTGVKASSKLSLPVSITVLGVIELLPCSDAATQSLDAVPVWKL